jgi:hypothetical protein
MVHGGLEMRIGTSDADLVLANGRYDLRAILQMAREKWEASRAPYERLATGMIWERRYFPTWADCMRDAWKAAKSRKAALSDLAWLAARRAA